MSSRPEFLGGLLDRRPAQLLHIPGAEPEFATFPDFLHPRIRSALSRAGIDRPFSHQAEALQLATAGSDVVVSTGTSSGKSLCYNLSVLQAAATEPVSKALYIFPTKALAQDQAAKLQSFFDEPWLRVEVYDGDTPKSRRSDIRHGADVVLTNPDMLHLGILPQHELWSSLLKGLRFIVIDEAHVYRGVFGAHVSGVFRRLLRLAAWRGSNPQVIATSATLQDPVGHVARLTGRQPALVSRDGAGHGEKFLVAIAAPLPEDAGAPTPNIESASLLAEAVESGHKALVFCRARSSAELVVRSARSSLDRKGLKPSLVDSYRGGYTAKERRQIEKDLFSGNLRGLASTNAMELGVDVGGLDVVVMNGYPGTLSSFWQQAGRAGRGGQEGIVVYLAHEDPLEQFIAQQAPETLLKAVETIRLNPAQPVVVRQQVRCAAYERALSPEEADAWCGRDVVEEMTSDGSLAFSAGRYFYPSHVSPAAGVNIRGGSSEGAWSLINDGEELGTMEPWRAKGEAHAGAVYLHRGETYLVEAWNPAVRRSELRRVETDYFTRPAIQSAVEPEILVDEVPVGGAIVQLWGLTVTTKVVGFRRMALDGQSVLGEEELDMPPDTLRTVGLRLVLDQDVLDLEDPESLAGWHGVQHALWAMAPWLASCDPRDLGSAWYALCPDNMCPGIYLYDRFEGGVGLAEAIYARAEEWLRLSLRLLTECPCEEGCPLCLLNSTCESSNVLLSKSGAVGILQHILTGPASSSNSAPIP